MGNHIILKYKNSYLYINWITDLPLLNLKNNNAILII